MLTLEHLGNLAEECRKLGATPVKEFALAGRLFAFNSRPAIMGVINLSRDSWYRESVCLSTERAVQRGRMLFEQGASLIDFGAESTLAHAARLDEQAQRGLLIPVIQELRQAGVLVSAETYNPQVARACLDAGANVLNLTGTEGAESVYKMAADCGAAVILCYVQGKHVRAVGDFDFSANPVGAMREYFERAIDAATKQGLDKILIDPGLGFYYRNLQDSAVRVRFQMEVFLNTFRLRSLGWPICHALPHAFEYFGEEVRSAEPFFAMLAAFGKTDLFRTHEVSRVKAVLDTLTLYEPVT